MLADYVREFFIDHNGLTYHYETGHWFKIVCKEVEATPEWPSGLKYSLVFFDQKGRCLVRFDNSHAVKMANKPNPTAYDHWHRFGDEGKAVPYGFSSVEQLLEDFMAAVDSHLPPDLRTSFREA